MVPRRRRTAGPVVARGRKRRDPKAERIARLEQEKRQLEQEFAKTRLWWMRRQNCTRLETLSEGAAPSRGRRRDRHRDRRTGPMCRGPGARPGAGKPRQGDHRRRHAPAARRLGRRPAPPGPQAAGAEPGRTPRDPRRSAQRPVRRHGAGRGVGHAARRRRLPRLDLHVLPAATPGRGNPGSGAGRPPTRPP